MQFNNPTPTKKTKYDNYTLNKINGPVAFADRSPPHPARVRLLCAFADNASQAADADTHTHTDSYTIWSECKHGAGIGPCSCPRFFY
jgi:hypothetical protein